MKSGHPVKVRSIRPEDKERVSEVFRKLDSESSYKRFVSPKKRLTDDALKAATEVDFVGDAATSPTVQAGESEGGMRTRTFVLLSVVLPMLLSCASPSPLDPSWVPPTVPRVELARYQGTWYELARLPLWFQRNCLRSQATYGLLGSGEVSVLNECETDGGSKNSILGRARAVDETNARLEVRFDTWFSVFIPPHPEGNYWIFYLDEEYSTVIVGTPNRKNLWIMARTQAVNEPRFAKLVDIARGLGFDTAKLIRRQ